MFHLILFQPEIPPNTGNVMRLAANTSATLHLVKPLGFQLTARALARAGMDYRELAGVRVHDHWDACAAALADAGASGRIFALTTRAARRHDEPAYRPGDAFLFGSESAGLPEWLHQRIPEERRLRLPMVAGSRSLNLANACAVMVYEAWRQCGFAGAA